MEDKKAQEEIYSQIVRAGKRTYFFDVRATRADDYYLTITKVKSFLMKTVVLTLKNTKYFLQKDFEKFKNAFGEALTFIEKEKEHMCQKKS